MRHLASSTALLARRSRSPRRSPRAEHEDRLRRPPARPQRGGRGQGRRRPQLKREFDEKQKQLDAKKAEFDKLQAELEKQAVVMSEQAPRRRRPPSSSGKRQRAAAALRAAPEGAVGARARADEAASSTRWPTSSARSPRPTGSRWCSRRAPGIVYAPPLARPHQRADPQVQRALPRRGARRRPTPKPAAREEVGARHGASRSRSSPRASAAR